MKQFFLIVFLMILSLLGSGCVPSDEPIDTTDNDIIDNDENIENNDQEDDIVNEPESLFTDMVTLPIQKDLYESVHNTSLDDVQDTLDIYYQDDSILPYVTLDSMIHLQSDVFSQGSFSLVKTDNLITITHNLISDSAVIDDSMYTLTIDTTTQMMTFSSRDFGQYNLIELYEPTFFSYTSVDTTDYVPFSIDLSEYTYDVIIDNDTIYIPFDLTNIIFSNDMGFLYYNAETVYLYPGLGFFPEVRNPDLEAIRPNKEIMEQTLQHMRLLFNHYHGVQEYGNGEDFEDFIRLFKTRFLTDYDHYKMIYANITRLDDLHTQYVMNGSWSQSTTVSPNNSYQLSDRIQRFNSALNSIDYVDVCEFGVNYTYLGEGIAKIEISNILNNTHHQFNDALEKATLDNTTKLIIDLSCNTGGSLFYTMELMALLTNDPLDLVLRDSADQSIQTVHYQANETTTYDFDYYVLTSPITYSAGNYLAYLMQDYLDAILIGQATSGGASSIKLVSVPSGALFTMSSTTQLRKHNGDSLELGLPVDYALSLTELKDNDVIKLFILGLDE